MFDGVSLVASVVTLVGVITQAVKYAKTLYRAHEELEALQVWSSASSAMQAIGLRFCYPTLNRLCPQQQVEQFTTVVQEIEGQQSLSPATITILLSAKGTLDQLQQLLKGKILTNANDSLHIRRRAWAKHRSELCRIQKSLKENRAILTLAIAMNSLLVVMYSELPDTAHSLFRLTANSEDAAATRSTGREIDTSNGSSPTNFRAQLSDVQDLMTQMLAQTRAVHSILRARPTTLLETSQHFFPETYTLESQIPRSCLVVIAAYEQATSADATTNIYKVLYLKSPRLWRWLILSMEIPRSSKYWAITRTAHANYKKWQTPVLCGAATLPYSLIAKIQDHLCQNGGIEDDTRLCLSLSNKDTIRQSSQIVCNDAFSSVPNPSTLSMDALNSFHDGQCPRFVESQVTQLELVDPPHCFASSINGILVYEFKCRDSSPSAEILYNIQVLHRMKGAPGFAKLIGVVTDHDGKHLKSYLIEFPKARWNIIQLAGNPSISWERREKWAVQLIQAVSQIHQEGFVIGGMTIWSIPVIIDDTDSVHFWYFRKNLVPGRTVGAYYPPELCYVRDMPQTTDAAKTPPVTSKTDIFHLGLLLWLLAESKPITRASPVCSRKGCDTPNDVTCDLSHAEPVALPQLPESVPKYYRDIVNNCRTEDPSDRPAAWELLRTFPTVSDLPEKPELREPLNPDMSTLGNGIRIARVACNSCWKRPLPLPIFHCNVCDFGDFDLCQTCYANGGHCDDSEHFLVELGKVGSLVVPRKHHSCANSSGVRDVIDI